MIFQNLWLGDRKTRGVVGRRDRSLVRRLRFQQLEQRFTLTAEGELFNLSQGINASGLAGTVSGVIDWGNGVQTSATVTQPSTGTLRAVIDYRYDTTGFFTPARRQVFEQAINSVVSRFTDQLTAITPSGTNTWTAIFTNPSTGAEQRLTNLTIPANHLLIFAGARAMPGVQVGDGTFGGFSANGSQSFIDTVTLRGQAGARATPKTDFAPWGGTIAFDTTASWYMGADEEGLPSNQNDFISVAVHEMLHVMGFGVADSWRTFVTGGTFRGPRSVAEYDGNGNVPLFGDLAHWAEGLQDGGRETSLDPTLTQGTRKLLTALDLAAMDDIGWDLVANQVQVSGTHVYADNGRFPTQVVLSGSQFGSLTFPGTTAVITNVAPTLTVVGDQTVQAGQPLLLTNLGTISDPGFNNSRAEPPTVESFTYTIDWGDQTPSDSGSATIDQVGNATRPTLASFDGANTYSAVGTYTVTVTARDDDNGQQVKTFRVTVTPPPQISLALSVSSVRENQGSDAATLTVRRTGGNLATPLTVQLSSSDTSEATIPTTATIPANETTVAVPIAAVDDNLLDGTQVVQITARGTNLDPATVDLNVSDFETLVADFTPEILREGATGTLAISVSNTDRREPLTVRYVGGDATQLLLPTALIIPAGVQQASFPITVIEETDSDGHQQLTYTFSAAGYQSVSNAILVEDNEVSVFLNLDNNFDVNNDGRIEPLDALLIINQLNKLLETLLNPADAIGNFAFVDVNGDYRLTPLDALLVINQLNRQGDGEPAGLVSYPASIKEAWPTQSDDEEEHLARDRWFESL